MPDKLIEGYREFRLSDFEVQKDLYETLGKGGQSPRVMLISCSDSRVDPTDIFHAYPGEMFVLRNVANIVPRGDVDTRTPSTAAALEYAVNVLKVKVILVMGHESCGGIDACLNGIEGRYVGDWIRHLTPARDRILARGLTGKDAQTELELEGVRMSLQNLMSFDFIAEKVRDGELILQGAYFSIISAKLLMMEQTGAFAEVPPSAD
ncbi:carbonic anhydrase [uncultured Algimonas sp.]|uniref:carbonic anhydrase n=1 Tax=uncultured Algimonas sp. TaxID=1547920 RepID=UPI0026076179|nr:carbonic anhydrase [uncultured Algimonas sp.]